MWWFWIIMYRQLAFYLPWRGQAALHQLLSVHTYRFVLILISDDNRVKIEFYLPLRVKLRFDFHPRKTHMMLWRVLNDALSYVLFTYKILLFLVMTGPLVHESPWWLFISLTERIRICKHEKCKSHDIDSILLVHCDSFSYVSYQKATS